LTNPIVEGSIPPEHAEIHEHCLQALENALYPLLEKLPVQIGLEFSGEAEKAADGMQQTVLTAQESRPIVERFYAHALEQAKSFVVPDLSLQPEAGAIYSESQSQRQLFDDWMNLIDKVIRLENKYKTILGVLETRFSTLVQKEVASHDNPFGPNVLCHSFHYALHGTGLDNHSRNRVYEAFAVMLDERLTKLYTDLKVLSKPLKGAGAETTLWPVSDGAAAAPKGEAQALTTALKSNGALTHAPHQASPLSTAPTANRASRAPAVFGSLTVVDPPAKPPAPPAAEPAPEPAPAKPQPTKPPAAKPSSEAPPPPDAFAAFVVLIRYTEAQANKNLSAAADFKASTLVAALGKLQAASPSKPDAYFSAYALQSGLAQILAQTGDEHCLSHPTVKETLMIVGLLLDSMLADMATLACVAPYIKKMQIPLLIAAFADPGALYAPSHPAREILNQLDYLTQAANAQGEINNAQLLHSLDALFDRIAAEAATNRQVFAETLEALEKLTQPLAKGYHSRLERVVDSCEGGQRLEHARLRADREINARIGGKTVPAVVVSLLDAGWRQLLVLTYLRRCGDNNDWRRQLASIDLLLSWLGKPGPATPPTPLNLNGLKVYLREGLSSVNSEPAEVNRILDKIDKLLPGDGSEPTPPAYLDIPAADTTREDMEGAYRARLSGFAAGDWLKFASTQNAWVPLRLAWIGHDPSRYVFANRKGIKTLDLDAAKFAQILDDKRASRIENLDGYSFVERTAKSLLSTLRDRLR
ncbi:MAG: DUF1631 family protein, partial [Candidatus Methylumidiphilus sp.]